MIRHLLTGQVVHALRAFYLPSLCFLLLPVGLMAQSGEGLQKPIDARTTITKTDPIDASTAAANPAPEPDTMMLLGTGVVVLLLFYARRRVRMPTPRAQTQ